MLLKNYMKELKEARKEVVSCMKDARIWDENVSFVPEGCDKFDDDSDDCADMDSECDELGI